MVTRDQATSAGERSGRSFIASASRLAWPRREPSVLADSTRGRDGFRPRTAGVLGSSSTAVGAPCSPSTSAAGASSRTTWALVPLAPNAETPARRGWP